jgi:putative aldouronate transport system substrate-binding protein
MMRGATRPLLILLAIFAVIAAPLARATPQGEAAAGAEIPTVTLTSSISLPPPEDNFMVKEVGRRLGIEFKPVLVAGDQYEQKLNALIASGDLPDVFRVAQATRIPELADNNIIMPLDDLLKEHGPDILENKGFMLSGPGKYKGQVYGIPAGQGNPVLLSLRKDWIDNLGMKVPTTLDEYYDVLYAMTYNDPNGDGKDNTIGLGIHTFWMQTFNHLFGAFGIARERPHYIDGKVIPYFMHPDYLDAVRFIRRLYDAKVMEPDFATINFRAANEKLWNGIYGGYDFTPMGTTQNWLTRYTEDPKPVFVFPVIRGPDGEGGTVQPVFDGGNFTVINARSDYPDAAMRLVNFMNSVEGDELLFLGLEGRHFEWTNEAKGEHRYLPPYDDHNTHRADGAWGYSTICPRYNGVRVKVLNETTKAGFELAEKIYIEDAYIYQKPAIELELGGVLDDMMKEALVSLITSDGDIEAEYTDWVKKYLKAGGETWIEQATEIYEEERGL